MTPAQQILLKASQDAVMKRIEGFQDGGMIPCESSVCNCAFRRQISVTTFNLIVMPDMSIELVCHHGVERFAKITGAKL